LNENLKVDNVDLQIESIKCLSLIIENSSEDEEMAKTFSELLPIVITAIDVLLSKENYEEGVVYQVLETLANQIELDNKAIDKYLPDVVRYFISEKFLLKKDLPIAFKESGLEILTVISDYRRPIYTKNSQLLCEVLKTLFFLGLDKSKIEERDTEETVQDIVMFALESFSKDLPKKKYFPLIKAKCTELLMSNDPNDHELMFLIYASVSEGLSDCLKPMLPDLMTNVFPHGLNNANDDIKMACIKACFHFSEFLQPEIVDHHEKVLPALINSLDTCTKTEINESTVFAIDIFVENMEEKHIKVY